MSTARERRKAAETARKTPADVVEDLTARVAAVNTPEIPKNLWTMDDIAEFTQLAYVTIRKMRSQGLLPEPIKFGAALRWDPAVIYAWALSYGQSDTTEAVAA